MKVRMYFASAIFAASLSASCLFSYWVLSEGPLERAAHTTRTYTKLLNAGEGAQALKLLDQEVDFTSDSPIAQEWLPAIQGVRNGYLQLQLYARVLAGNPAREDTYQEISRLIEVAPEEFQMGPKLEFLNQLQGIPNIEPVMLAKYGLSQPK